MPRTPHVQGLDQAALGIADRDGHLLPPRLVGLLLAVHATGSLAAASRQTGLSYRYAWGLLREPRDFFGVPLLPSTRGRGAQLTTLGERLV